ncbi:MAG: hypothetical protein KatS3mg012_1295 [Gaiellaceae bacterium]|jgi:precorrin-2 dehydrogenase/sirohydrochlorin ferrochelatase|nr:MAG: hypothetical protein KatS3mg012_1295 [Gaiellaceae bacterium]
MAEKRYYMACLDLERRSCLVVGGGSVALEKVRGLLECGAHVTVVAPEVCEELRALDVEILERPYRPTDLDNRFLVIAATSRAGVNARVSRDARARSLFCNVADDPERCTFILPAVARRGPLAIAVSTSGASPALAQRLRDEAAERLLRPEVADLAERLRALRPWARTNLKTYESRRRFFASLVAEELG